MLLLRDNLKKNKDLYRHNGSGTACARQGVRSSKGYRGGEGCSGKMVQTRDMRETSPSIGSTPSWCKGNYGEVCATRARARAAQGVPHGGRGSYCAGSRAPAAIGCGAGRHRLRADGSRSCDEANEDKWAWSAWPCGRLGGRYGQR